MNRRAFLATAAMTPILASAFGPVRAQTAGGRLLYVGTYTNTAAGSKGIYAWRFDAAASTVTSLGLAAETDSPSWVVVHPGPSSSTLPSRSFSYDTKIEEQAFGQVLPASPSVISSMAL